VVKTDALSSNPAFRWGVQLSVSLSLVNSNFEFLQLSLSACVWRFRFFAAPLFGGACNLAFRFRWSTRILNFFNFLCRPAFGVSAFCSPSLRRDAETSKGLLRDKRNLQKSEKNREPGVDRRGEESFARSVRCWRIRREMALVQDPRGVHVFRAIHSSRGDSCGRNFRCAGVISVNSREKRGNIAVAGGLFRGVSGGESRQRLRKNAECWRLISSVRGCIASVQSVREG
jgi:hypothetical protein